MLRVMPGHGDDPLSWDKQKVLEGNPDAIAAEEGLLRVMSRHGDDRFSWNKRKVLEGNPDAIAAVREAERIFAEERRKGATAFLIEAGKPAQLIREFNATTDGQIIVVPRVVGG
jgi:Asp/Glu/hydantoin racemase